MGTSQRFVQILEFETDRIDEMRALAEEGSSASRAEPTARRAAWSSRTATNRTATSW